MSKNLAFEEPVVQLREKIDELKQLLLKQKLICLVKSKSLKHVYHN